MRTERHLRWSQLNPDGAAERARGLAERGERDGGVRGIKQAVHGGAAGLHAHGHLGLGECIFLKELDELERQRLFHGAFLDFSEHAFFLEEVPEVTAAMGSFVHWHINVSKMIHMSILINSATGVSPAGLIQENGGCSARGAGAPISNRLGCATDGSMIEPQRHRGTEKKKQ